MTSLFHPFRALGYITEDLPFAVERRGNESFVTVSVGKAWQVYKCAKLTLAYVGPELPGTITALASRKDLTFAAVGGSIIECTRLHRSGQYRAEGGCSILQLLVLGELLLSLSAERLTVWRIGQYSEPENVLQLGPQFRATCLAHPDTYLNKVAIGGASGELQLWNFATGRLLFSFSLAPCAVTALAPSPATDVVGVGLADGRVLLHNLKYDERVAAFDNASGVGARTLLGLDGLPAKPKGSGAVTAISFRTGLGTPLMAAGGGAGAVTVWNLEQRRVHTILKDAHDGPLLALHFFPGEARLMSAAADNSLKQWLFDATDGAGRLLRFRAGHAAPPAVVRHYGDGERLLSAGQDRAFRLFSVVQDQQSRELSQGHIERRAKKLKVGQEELRLPRVTAMDACQVRERDWANVITAHAGDPVAYTWRLQSFSMGEHALRQPGASRRSGGGDTPAAAAPVTAVAVSACGNFGIVGTAAGRIDRHNLQSGLHRGTYARKAADGRALNAHAGAVVGVAADSANRRLVSVGGDGWLRVWSFRPGGLTREVRVGSRPTRLAAHPGTALVAVACDDLVLRMFDAETGQQVRSFRGHSDRVTDLAISADARWLLSSAMDGTLRVADIPTARTLQVLRLGAPVTSLSLAPNQELLATAHVGKRGIYLWANHFVFGGPADIRPSEQPIRARLASLQSGFAEADLGESEPEESDASGSDSDSSSSSSGDDGAAPEQPADVPEAGRAAYEARLPTGAPQPLLPQLVTLSLLPRTQWQNLVHLDAIRERSKPTEPPRKPEAAPFFLPTVAGLSRDPVFDVAAEPAAAAATAGPSGALPGWGDGEADAADGSGSDGEGGGSRKRGASEQQPGGKSKKRSRVVRGGPAKQQQSEFVRLLRSGAESGDFAALMQLLRGLSPVAVDEQLQLMRVVDSEAADAEEVADLGRVLQFVEGELAAGRSFEHMQALLRAFLNIHGETVSEHAALRERAASLQERLAGVWLRLQGKLQHVRGLVNFLGNLPS